MFGVEIQLSVRYRLIEGVSGLGVVSLSQQPSLNLHSHLSMHPGNLPLVLEQLWSQALAGSPYQ